MDSKKNNDKKGMSEKSDSRSERCCYYVMDACGEYYLSSGCYTGSVRYCGS